MNEDDFVSGFDNVLKRPLTIRRVPEAVRRNPEAVSNYLAAAQAHARLTHPNILSIYDIDHERLVIEHVQGVRLLDFLRVGPNDRRAWTRSFERQLLPELLGALRYAHGNGIVHRALSPACIWLFPDGQLKLWGFGLLYWELSQQLNSARGLLPQEFYYMSPEQARGEKVDRATDIWALGVLLYVLEWGEYPFPGATLPELITQVMQSQPARPLSPMVRRCLERDPALRLLALEPDADQAGPPFPEALAHHVLASNYYKAAKYDLAALEWKKAYALDTLQPAFVNNLGAALWKREFFEEAADCFRRGPSRFNQALALQRDGKLAAAVELLKLAVHVAPRLAAAYILLGECLLELGRVAEALEELQKSMILDGVSSARSLRLMARIYRDKGRTEEAQAYEEKAAECGETLPHEPEVIGLEWTLPEL